MAATLVGTPDATTTGNATTVSVNLPAGITAGDVGVAGVVYSPVTGDIAAPSGWTFISDKEVNPVSSMRARYFWRTMDGSESGTLAFSFSGSATKMSAAVAVVRGVTGPPTVQTASGIAADSPTVSVAASSVAVGMWMSRGTSATSISPPSGFTLHDSVFGAPSGQTCAAIASNLTPSGASVGGGTWTPNASHANTATATFALAVTGATRVTTTLQTRWDVAAAPTPVSTLTYPLYIAHRFGASVPGRCENTAVSAALSLANDPPTTVLECDCGPLSSAGGEAAALRIAMTHEPDDLSTAGRIVQSDGTTVVTGTSASKTLTQWRSYLTLPRAGVSGSPQPCGTFYTGNPGDPGLADLLIANPTRVAAPEIKDSAVGPDLIATIQSLGLTGQTIVQSFTYSVAQSVAAAGLNALWLTNSFATNSAAAVYASGIRWVGVDRTIADLAGYCTTAHAAGLKVIAYTVNSVANKDAALAAGVDGMFTDRPDLINAGAATRVTTTLSTSWSVAQRRTAATSTAWAVTQRATSTTSTSWAVSQRLAATTPNDWAVRARATSTASSGWSVAQRTTKATSTAWDVAQRVTAATPQTWAVRTRATSTTSQQWGVTGRVVTTLSTSWDTQSTEPTTRVTTTLATRWAVAARASSPLLTRWDVAQRAAGPTVTLGWAVRSRAVSATPTRWDVSARLVVASPSSWETRSRIATTLAQAWSVSERRYTSTPTRWSVAPTGASRDVTFLGFDERDRTITFTERQRTITYQEAPMRLHPTGREYYDPGPATEPAVTAWEASFDGGDTWHAPTTVDDGRPLWLIAGPNADPDAQVLAVVDRTVRPLLRATDTPELLVQRGPVVKVSIFA